MTRCPHCTRSFTSENDAFQHVRSKHAGMWNPFVAQRRARREAEQETSLADELIDAKLAAAMGEPVSDHLLAMFPEEF